MSFPATLVLLLIQYPVKSGHLLGQFSYRKEQEGDHMPLFSKRPTEVLGVIKEKKINK